MSAPTIVEVEGRKLKLTNLDKILYPVAGFTKGQVVDYYVRIAPVFGAALGGTGAYHEALSRWRRRRAGIFL